MGAGEGALFTAAIGWLLSAIKFATLALAAQLHLANNIPAASGASRLAILGKLVAAPRLARGADLPKQK